MTNEQKKEVVDLAQHLYADIIHAVSSDKEETDPLLASLTERFEADRAEEMANRSFVYAEAFVLRKADYSEGLHEEPEPKQEGFLRKNWYKLLMVSIFCTYLTYLLLKDLNLITH